MKPSRKTAMRSTQHESVCLLAAKDSNTTDVMIRERCGWSVWSVQSEQYCPSKQFEVN